MTKLSRDARDLIEAARAGESTLADARAGARARVRARVLARVGAGVAIGSATALGTSSTAAKTALSAGLLFKCVAAVGIASVVAVVASFASTPTRPARAPLVTMGAPAPLVAMGAPAPLVAMGAPAPKPPAPAERAPELVVEPVTVTAPRPPAVTATPVPRGQALPAAPDSSLEAETALLEKAQAELRAGHPDRALAALDEHDAEFKGGVLHEERRAGRILALCAAGRTGEATAEAARFLAESPRSPMAERVRSSCAGHGAASP
jgi:hypothetical protein